MIARKGWHGARVVEPFNKPEGHCVFGLAVGGDAVPVPLDEGGKFLERGKLKEPEYGMCRTRPPLHAGRLNPRHIRVNPR